MRIEVRALLRLASRLGRHVITGSDEVSLTIRLYHRDGYDRPVDACEERCLKEIRERLRELGIAER